MKKTILLSLLTLYGCIGSDIIEDHVDEMIIIENAITSLKVGEMHQFNAQYLNNVGMETATSFNWNSSDESVISIDINGLATAHTAGTVTITVQAAGVSKSLELEAGEETSAMITARTAEISTVSSYPLSETATLKIDGDNLILQFSDDFITTSALPGLYVYLTNNVNTLKGAFEIGKVTAFSGAQSYNIASKSDLFEYNFVLFYCKPFVVPVGNGKLNP